MTLNTKEPVDRDEVDLLSLASAAWRFKYYLIAGTAFGIFIALLIGFTATPRYRAEVVVTEVRENAMNSSSSLASQIGGLASLAGMSLSGMAASHEAKAVLNSRHLIEEFIKRNNLLQQLKTEATQPATLWLAVRQFQSGVLSIRDNIPKGTTTVAIEWTDAKTAAKWANSFVALANELMRTRAIEDANRNIAYLNDQISRSNVVELRRAMYNIVESETKTLMLASGRVEYAFTIVDPAVAPDIRSSPRRTIMVVLGTILGFCAGSLAAFVRSMWLRQRSTSSQVV